MADQGRSKSGDVYLETDPVIPRGRHRISAHIAMTGERPDATRWSGIHLTRLGVDGFDRHSTRSRSSRTVGLGETGRRLVGPKRGTSWRKDWTLFDRQKGAGPFRIDPEFQMQNADRPDMPMSSFRPADLIPFF